VLPLRDFIPTRRPAVMTASLILANLAVFLWELGTTEIRVDHYAYYPCSVEGPCTGIAVDHLPAYEGALSAMFLHASWVHVLGNMLFLWIFGNNIEDALGRFRFLLWYIASGLVATGAQTFVTLRYAGPEAASVPNIGASGAIAAVLGAYLVLLPNARVLTLVGVFPIPVPAFLFLGVWFVLQLWAGGMGITHPEVGGGVAFFAHVGGFLFGAATIRSLVRNPPGLVPR